MLYPLVNVLASSFSGARADGRSGWQVLLAEPKYLRAIGNTVLLGVAVGVSVGVAVGVGVQTSKYAVSIASALPGTNVVCAKLAFPRFPVDAVHSLKG